MGALSRVLPKPAWPLAGKPLLLWGADLMRKAGLQNVACNVHHLPDRMRRAAGSGLEIFEEPMLLGSAGGLSHVARRASDPLAVWNGDAIAEVPWGRFVEEHRRRGADLSWLLVPHPGGPWNPLWLDEDGRILPPGEKGQGPYHFTGASLWGPAALALLEPGRPADTKADVLPRLAHHAGIVVEPFPWLEIGTPDQLIAAASILAPNAEGRLQGCYLHPDSEPGGRLTRCILGPGVRVPASMTDQNAFWFDEGGCQVRLCLD